MTEPRVPDPDDQFFEALAGRAPGQPSADTLRAVLLEEAATIESVTANNAAAPTPAQLALRERITRPGWARSAGLRWPAWPPA